MYNDLTTTEQRMKRLQSNDWDMPPESYLEAFASFVFLAVFFVALYALVKMV